MGNVEREERRIRESKEEEGLNIEREVCDKSWDVKLKYRGLSAPVE